MPEPTSPLPMRATVIVSLRAGLLLALANIVCVVIFSWAWMHVRAPAKTLAVTGSAKRTIASDLVVWKVKVSSDAPQLPGAYDALKVSVEKTVGYLKSHGVMDPELKISSITTEKHFVMTDEGKMTDRIRGFGLVQTVEVSSPRVTAVADVARDVTALIKDGVMLESEAPSFYYTKIADLKISMLADATRDAQTRAQQIAQNSGARLGTLGEARMGVLQINPVHSSEASGEGNNDTTSFEKDVIAVVSTRFDLHLENHNAEVQGLLHRYLRRSSTAP